jgi:hypothetical protein
MTKRFISKLVEFKKHYNKVVRYLNKDLDNCIYLVYTMSKVGTTTLSKSLVAALPKAHVFHLHFLEDYWIDKCSEDENVYNKRVRNEFLDFRALNPHKKIKIITMVRDPISREISGIFQNWDFSFGKRNEILLPELLAYVQELKFELPLTWFSTEFNKYLNFDIFSKPFNHKKGYTLYKQKGVDVICLKLERLNDAGEKAIGRFIGLPISLKTENRTSEKSQSQLYDALKRNFKANAKTIELVYNSNYVKHFYSPKEIDEMKMKWQ